MSAAARRSSAIVGGVAARSRATGGAAAMPMTLVRAGDGWRVEGPGSDRASVAYATLDGDRLEYRVEDWRYKPYDALVAGSRSSASFTACLLAATFPRVEQRSSTFARHNDTASHIVLIPFVDRGAAVSTPRVALRIGAVGAGRGHRGYLRGTACCLISRRPSAVAQPGTDSLSARRWPARVIAWLGGVLLFFGPEPFARELFPLLFLGFMIPFPDALVAARDQPSEGGSADVVAGLFTLTRHAVLSRRLSVLAADVRQSRLPTNAAAFDSSIALLLTSLLAGHVFLRSGWKKAILVLAVLPLALLKNAIRIVSLTLLRCYVNPSFLTGRLHHEGGIVFFPADARACDAGVRAAAQFRAIHLEETTMMSRFRFRFSISSPRHRQLEEELVAGRSRSAAVRGVHRRRAGRRLRAGIRRVSAVRSPLRSPSSTAPTPLRFALMAAGVEPGDAVVTVSHTFIATIEAISQAGAATEFVDVDERTY